MSPAALSFSASHFFTNKTHHHPTHSPLPQCASSENPLPQTTPATKMTKRNILGSALLSLATGDKLLLSRPARAELESPAEFTSNRMSYSRFLQYLDADAVKKVDLYENGTSAIAEISNTSWNKIQIVKVQLPGLPKELLRKMKEKNVDFAAHSMEVDMGAVALDFLGYLAFPLILLGILLLRTPTNIRGGPSLPFGLGRTLTPGHDPVQKVTLIPRSQARGLTWFIPSEDATLISKQQLFARIVGGLGGRAAEEVIFGEAEMTTGAASDLQQITQIATQMVTVFGMSEIGPWALTDPVVQNSDLVLRMLARNSMSEKLAEDIDTSVRSIVENAYEISKMHIRSNKDAIDKLVEVLIEKETLTGDEFRAILSEFTDIFLSKSSGIPVTHMIEV